MRPESAAGPAVAVVVVHGVGDQKAHETARGVSRLLFRFPGETGRYAPFYEAALSVERSPAVVNKSDAPPSGRRLKRPFEERSPSLRASHKARDGKKPRDVGHEFMKEQLAGYMGDGPGALYESVRLESTREAGPESGRVRVHVFEMFWADISRPAPGALQFIGDLYQLLLHLASLGRQVIDSARSERADSALWGVYWWVQTWTIRLLTLFVPALNLSLLVAAGTLLLPALNETTRLLVAVGAAALGVAAAFGALILRRRDARAGWFWAVSAALVLGAAAMAGFVVFTELSASGPEPLLDILSVEWWIVATVLLWVILSRYQKQRPGALVAGLVMHGLCLVGFVAARLVAPATRLRSAAAGFQVFQAVFLALEAVWGLLLAGVLVSAVAGLIVAIVSKTRKVRRIAWTARFTLALPTTLLMIVTLAVWSALLRVGRSWIAPMDVMPWAVFGRFGIAGPLPLALFLDDLLTSSAAVGFIIAPMGFVLFLGAVLWAALPSLRAELSPPPSGDSRWASFTGGWVTRGILLVAGAADVLTLLLVAGLASGIQRSWLRAIDARPLISASAFAILLLLASKKWLQGARAVLDILLDVDNYMREYPRDAAPRARIVERYVSLLRHLCAWRGPDGEGYRGVVLVSHSQGAVITSDLLRFLRREKDARLERLVDEIRMASVTLGAPLRQLYAACFPDHYAWLGEPGQRDASPAPDPADLGVEEWLNAYRSGDYVGRNLWFPPEWERHEALVMGGRRELALGAGAHTHYLDQRGRDIAAELDALIVKLANGPRRAAQS